MSHRPDTTSGELPFGEPAFARVFGRPRPRWFNIPAHRPFVEDLARGLVEILSPIGPEALSDAIVLTPTRRGMRSLTEAFVQAAGGKATLLPQIRALGDLDEGEPPFEPGDLAVDLPPAVSALRRRFELARLIHDHAHLLERDGVDARDALDLADSLGAFLDSVQIEEVGGLDRLAGLVEGDMAEHWIRSVRFLSIATELWPKRLEELGLVDVNVRRTRLLRVLADQWTHNPPPRALIAAGSTGTAPATAELLKVIANAPQGCLVLPGLDQELEDKAWDEVRDAHPQGALKRLLERAGITRADVQAWPNPDTAAQAVIGRSRRRVINEALRPAEVTNDWLVQIDRMLEEGRPTGVNPVAEGLDGLSLIHARDEIEAADIAALALRETLETPGATAALVTPDAVLARRVSAALTRWGIEADSSAGQGLGVLPVGMLLGLMARAAARHGPSTRWTTAVSTARSTQPPALRPRPRLTPRPLNPRATPRLHPLSSASPRTAPRPPTTFWGTRRTRPPRPRRRSSWATRPSTASARAMARSRASPSRRRPACARERSGCRRRGTRRARRTTPPRRCLRTRPFLALLPRLLC